MKWIDDHHDNPSSGSPSYGNLSSGNSESNTSQIASGKFQKQYIAGKDLRINIVQKDITKMTVESMKWISFKHVVFPRVLLYSITALQY
jgi:hypothetical protein